MHVIPLHPAPGGELAADDTRKAGADFRLLDARARFTIQWRDGTQERVTESELFRLQAMHPNWVTDF